MSNKNYRLGEHFQRVATTVRHRELLGFWAASMSCAYGFPTDVVELRTGHIPSIPEAHRIELQTRTCESAIAEYAPVAWQLNASGQAVVRTACQAATGDLPPTTWSCPSCGRFHRSAAPLDSHCVVCGANVFAWPKRYGTFLIPEFGFVASRTPETPANAGCTAARLAFTSQTTPCAEAETAALEPVPELSGDAVWVEKRYSRYGKLALVNSGYLNAGFRVCAFCGWAEPAKPLAQAGEHDVKWRIPIHVPASRARGCL